MAGRGWTGVLCGERGWYLKEGGQGWSPLRERPLSKDLKEGGSEHSTKKECNGKDPRWERGLHGLETVGRTSMAGAE